MSRDSEYIDFKKGERREALGRAILCTVFYPIVLLYYLGYSSDFRGFTFLGYLLEFNYDLVRMWKAALGFRVKRDTSDKLKCIQETLYLRKNKIDKDVYEAFTGRFGMANSLSKHLITWFRYGDNDSKASVKRVGKDKYLLRVYLEGNWTSDSKYVNSNYLLSKQQVIDFLKSY